jgi:hypothetical protein
VEYAIIKSANVGMEYSSTTESLSLAESHCISVFPYPFGFLGMPVRNTAKAGFFQLVNIVTMAIVT